MTIFSKPWAACNGFDMLITVDMSEFLYSCGAPQFEPWLLDDRDARWGGSRLFSKDEATHRWIVSLP